MSEKTAILFVSYTFILVMTVLAVNVAFFAFIMKAMILLGLGYAVTKFFGLYTSEVTATDASRNWGYRIPCILTISVGILVSPFIASWWLVLYLVSCIISTLNPIELEG